MVCIVFGFSTACVGPLLPDLIIETVGQKKLGIGYGYVLIFEGLGSFVGPPVGGELAFRVIMP